MRVIAIPILLACALAGYDVSSTGSAVATPILVELFTSEGCSSCPPADAWVQTLDAQPLPGAQFIVLSEHVDYWNHDGWKDPNSSALLTERQNAYSHTLGFGQVYTPQVIVNGASELHLDKPHQTGEIFKKAAASATLHVNITAVSVDGNNLRARIETDAKSETHDADIYVAVALDHVESQVLRGENSGKHLTHVAVVQSLKKIGKVEAGKSFAQDSQWKLKAGTDPGNIRLISFVQESGTGRVLGAALQKPPFK